MKPEEHGELAANRDLWEAVPADLAERFRVAHAEVDGALCVAVGGIPAVLVNHVMGLGLDAPATPAQLDAIAEFYGPFGVSYQIAVSPDARPGFLSHVLEERGFKPGYHWQKFARGVEPPPEVETELRVDAVGTEGAADFSQAFVAGFGLPAVLAPWFAELPGRPGWHCFVAYDGETPAATGALFVADTVGWLGMAGTVPEHRRRGAQGAILAARIRLGAELGCRTLVTETGVRETGRPSPSHDNIERLGFRPTYVRQNWLVAAKPGA